MRGTNILAGRNPKTLGIPARGVAKPGRTEHLLRVSGGFIIGMIGERTQAKAREQIFPCRRVQAEDPQTKDPKPKTPRGTPQEKLMDPSQDHAGIS